MQALALLLVCAGDPTAPPPQSTLPAHLPCEVRPPEPQVRPKAGIKEEDSPAGVAPKGTRDDRQVVKRTTGVPELDALLIEAKRAGRPVAREFNEDGLGLVWYRATPDGWLNRVPPPSAPAPRVVRQPARSVPAPQPFRDVYSGSRYVGRECEYDPDHVCNRCGTVQLDIDHWNPDGTHTHVCPRCRHSWRHRG